MWQAQIDFELKKKNYSYALGRKNRHPGKLIIYPQINLARHFLYSQCLPKEIINLF